MRHAANADLLLRTRNANAIFANILQTNGTIFAEFSWYAMGRESPESQD